MHEGIEALRECGVCVGLANFCFFRHRHNIQKNHSYTLVQCTYLIVRSMLSRKEAFYVTKHPSASPSPGAKKQQKRRWGLTGIRLYDR